MPDPRPTGEPRRLTHADVERAAASIAAAFAWHEPWGAWVLPDPRTREQTLRQLVADDIVGRFLEQGECSTIETLSVTLWIPPPSHPNARSFRARRSEAEYLLYGERADALRAGDALLDSIKPEGEHWYLDTIATEPSHRRRGLGSRLLDHDLAVHDQRGHSCALDTHTIENVRFYERRGFETVAETTLPDQGPDVYIMVREPR